MKKTNILMICIMFFVLCSSFALADANDVCSGASTMTVGTSNHGLINPQGDIDWGKWYVSSPGRLTVTLDVPSSKDYSLAVYSSCSQRVCLSGRGTGLDETCVIDVQPGYYYTKVWGDYNQWSDYYRYYIATSLEVAPEPDRYDFVVGSIQPTISNPTTEDSFNINYDVRNNGPDDFYGSFGTTLYIDGVNKGTITRSGSFNSGTTQSFTKYGVQLSAGSHSIRVVADSSNQADETNEGNNEKTIYISVSAPAPPQYDLVVERITPSIQFPTAGVPFNIDYVVRNNGQDRYTGSFRTTMYIDGNIDSSVPRTDISAGGTEMFTKYNVPLTEGRHLIRIITDSSNEVSETNEYNNERTLYIDVVAPELPEYDLILESITPSIQFPIAGEPFDIDFIVKNTGSDGYPGSFTTQLYIDDVLKATSPRTDISSGGTEAFTRRDVVLTEGRHLARVLTDTGDEVDETDESNNERTLFIDVIAPADPCAGIVCDDVCDGTTLNHSGQCVDGICNYQIEIDSTECGYEPPTNTTCEGGCDDYCENTASYTNGRCVNGLCYYDVDLFSPDCGYEPPVEPIYSGIIVLDPGHALSTDEGILNHRISAALKPLLEEDGFDVYETSSDLSVDQRANYADGLGADILLSIHFNAFDTTAEGSEAFYYDADDLVLCEEVLPHVVGILPSNNRGVKPDTASAPGSLGVLRSRDGPACLVEMEFLDRVRQVTFEGETYSNFRDLLYSDDYLAASSQALREGIRDYFDGQEQEPDPVDPCDGVVCDDKCEGTTWKYNGYCSDGSCHYTLEPMSTICGYDPCAFMLCEDKCEGTTEYSDGSCSDGECSYTTIIPDSESCGWEEPPIQQPASISITGLTITPNALSCDAEDDVVITLRVSNSGDLDAEDVGIGFWSPGLATGMSYTGVTIEGHDTYVKEMPMTVPPNADPDTYPINIAVNYNYNKLTGTVSLIIPDCDEPELPEPTDYFIDNMNAIPDVFQRDTYLDLPGHKVPGDYFCGPSSASNIVVWLYENGFTNLSNGTQTEALKYVIHNLSVSDYMDTTAVGATDPIKLVSGLDDYITDRGYEVTSMRFQGWKPVEDQYDTDVTAPELDWIKEGVKNYSGVLLHLGWYKYDESRDTYNRSGGHWVTAVGFGLDSNGNTNPDFIIIHDPDTRHSKNEYVNMTNITSGTFVHTHATIPNSAVGFYIMDGVQKGSHDYAILEGAVRFNVEERTPVIELPPPANVPTSGSSGGSGGGGGRRNVVSQTPAQTIVIPAPAAPSNPALLTLKSAQGSSNTGLDVRVEREVAGMEPETFADEMQMTHPAGEGEPEEEEKQIIRMVLNCDSDDDCGTGSVCLPSGVFSRLVSDTTKCCPQGSTLVGQTCVAPEETAGWNQECGDGIGCEDGLECISNAHWYSFFNWDRGVCCEPGDPLENDRCTLRFNPEVPEDEPWPFEVNSMLADVNDDVGRTDYAWAASKENDYGGDFGAETYKCNLYVNNKLNEAGLPAPMNSEGSEWPLRAGNWADTTRDIDHWDVVEEPLPGDVVACRASNVNSAYSGHVGIVTEVTATGGSSVSAGTYSVVEDDFGFDGNCDYTFRRYTE